MPTGLIGYDPTHIHELTRRIHVALDHVRRAPPSLDPCAETALSTLRLVGVHLEHDWLPPLARITGSTAMTEFGATALATRQVAALPRADAEGSGPPASNSLASELHAPAAVAVPRPATGAPTPLPNGWYYGCGPVSATTGQAASGCEWMPPERWDLSTPLLVASLLPVSGELIDAVDCARGDIPCEAVVVPFLSGRGIDALDDVATGVARAADVVRPTALGSADSWGLPATLDDHFLRHGADLGATSAEHYARQASEFLVHAITENLPTKIDPRDGKIRIWDPTTDTFGAYNPDGTTATFYKLDADRYGAASSLAYWGRQPG